MKISMLLSLACLSIFSVSAQQKEVEDAIQKKYYDQYGKEGEDKLNAMLGGMNAKPAAEYKFTTSVTQHITNYEKGKVKSESDMKFYMNSGNMNYAMEGSQMGESSKKKSSSKMITVYDMPNSTMLMYNYTDKTLFAMNLGAFKAKASRDSAKQASTSKTATPSDVKCGKTGKTKSILGHECYEWVCKKEGANTYTAMWINSDVKIGEVPFMAGGMPGTYGKSSGVTGAVLEIDSYKDGELITTMVVTEINEHADLLIKSADFTLQGMPAVKFQ